VVQRSMPHLINNDAAPRRSCSGCVPRKLRSGTRVSSLRLDEVAGGKQCKTQEENHGQGVP